MMKFLKMTWKMLKFWMQHQPAPQPIAVVQPALEVVVTDQQCTMTFNGEQMHICEEVEVPVPNPSLKLLQHVQTENYVYTFSTYNINIFFTITITINITIRSH